MKFDELDRQMRVFETASDHTVLPGIYIVVRLDGRGFTSKTEHLTKPFDDNFHAAMVNTTAHLVSNSGFRVVYGYTQSDEISLLLDRNDNSFGRKERKIISVLAGEASAKFGRISGWDGTFDARISQLPQWQYVVDYFSWRKADSERNALNAYCYWTLRQQGLRPAVASNQLKGMSASTKLALLDKSGIKFSEVTSWHRFGTGIYFEEYLKEATNPLTGQSVTAQRKRLKVDEALPDSSEYIALLERVNSGNK